MKTVTKTVAVAIAVLVASGAYAINLRAGAGAAPVAAGPAPAKPAPVEQPSLAPSPTPTAAPTPTRPSAPDPIDPRAAKGKLIEVSIAEQTLVAWQDGVEVMRFTISTGKKGYPTPTGTFRVHTKYDNRWSRKWKVWMPYAMFWHPRYGYAFHELPYKPGREHQRIGATKLGRRDSKGCVRLGLGDAKRLYEWTPVGTQVWIH